MRKAITKIVIRDMDQVIVMKLNPSGEETWRYSGQVLERYPDRIVLQAHFNRADLPFHGILLKQGDRFVETFYSDRWYNVFEIHDREDDHLKGWYCNLGHPAVIEDDMVSYIDLALDLLVYPDGEQLVLDEDEFTALHLPPETLIKAHQALEELQDSFRTRFAG